MITSRFITESDAVKASCVDKDKSCAKYRNKGYCTRRYVTWMKKNCAKTCGCGSNDKKKGKTNAFEDSGTEDI